MRARILNPIRARVSEPTDPLIRDFGIDFENSIRQNKKNTFTTEESWMTHREIPDFQVLLEHISRFINAVPDSPSRPADWSELMTLRNSALDSLQRLQASAGSLPMDKGGDKCPGALPKQ